VTGGASAAAAAAAADDDDDASAAVAATTTFSEEATLHDGAAEGATPRAVGALVLPVPPLVLGAVGRVGGAGAAAAAAAAAGGSKPTELIVAGLRRYLGGLSEDELSQLQQMPFGSIGLRSDLSDWSQRRLCRRADLGLLRGLQLRAARGWSLPLPCPAR
jgi:hypothetical protein